MTQTPKESPLFGYCRALVILAFVTCIPAIAIVWGFLPSGTPQNWYKRLTAFREKAEDTEPSYRARNDEGSKPGANSDAHSENRSEIPPGEMFGGETGNPANPYHAFSPDPATPSPAPPGFAREPRLVASFDTQTPSRYATETQIPGQTFPISQASYDAAEAFPAIAAAYQPASGPASQEGTWNTGPFSPGTVPAGMSPETTAQNELARLQEELKEFGATFFRIQTWGTEGELYRVTCYVAAPDNVQYQKHFQVIASDATAALREMIGEVRKWLAGHAANRGR